MAFSVHALTHSPHSSQRFLSILAIPLSTEIACGGHTSTHSPQPLHLSESTLGTGITHLRTKGLKNERTCSSVSPFFCFSVYSTQTRRRQQSCPVGNDLIVSILIWVPNFWLTSSMVLKNQASQPGWSSGRRPNR